MKTRSLLTLAMALSLCTACGELGEREDGHDDEAEEAGERGLMELPFDLMAQAEVNVEAALATALARVPGGKATAGELEEEDGRLIYSFDLRVDGREGIEEVHVDARTGEVVAQEHEDPDDDDDDGR